MNISKFTSLALDKWAHAQGVKLAFIQPGKPTQNAYIESFNGSSGMSASMTIGS